MRAVMVFCEGAHDVVFATRSLGALASAEWMGAPIKDLPSPFGPLKDPANPIRPKVESIIVRRYGGRTLEDRHLGGAMHPPPPIFEALVRIPQDGVIYCLIRCHGDGASQAAGALLDDVLNLREYGVEVTEVAAAFLYDADEAGVAAREARFAAEQASRLGSAGAPRHGEWKRASDCPIGLFVFHEPSTGTGTLEAALSPLVEAEWPERWEAAGAYLSAHTLPEDPVSARPAERLKAQIGVTSQFRFPGDAMTQIIRPRGLPSRHFRGTASRALVDFLRGVRW